MTLLDLLDAINADSVSAACEILFKECIDHAESNAKTNYTLTESKDLCIVMLS